HFGTARKPNHDVAKSVMNRVFQGNDNRSMKKTDLENVMRFTRKQNDIQAKLGILKRGGRLQDVNTVSRRTVMNEFLSGRELKNQHEVAQMLQQYGKIRGEDIRKQVRVLFHVADKLTNNNESEAKDYLLRMDRYHFDLTPKTRQLRHDFLRCESPTLQQRDELANELRQMARNLVERRLAEFRDDPKVAKYLGDNELPNAIRKNKITQQEIGVLINSVEKSTVQYNSRKSPNVMITTLKNRNWPITQAFQLHCQHIGVPLAWASKELAEFIDKLDHYVKYSDGCVGKTAWMKEFRELAQYIDENLKIEDNASRNDRGDARNANDTLKRLIKGKAIKWEDARHLSNTLKQDLKKKLQKLQMRVPNANPQVQNDGSINNSDIKSINPGGFDYHDIIQIK
ncbi:MAG: hypothetical protein MI861_18630, partial [Pirellulales bacterium]|nr:hypothetical protein [Pirellulales bacterium]